MSKAVTFEGKGKKGYRVMASGTGKAYLAITIPLEAGFKQGERVTYQAITHKGIDGLFISKIPIAETKNIQE